MSVQLLSEDVFDFSGGEMTQQKIKELKQSLNSNEFIMFSIVKYPLETLLKFFLVPAYWNLALQCLTEVGSLQFGSFYDVQYVKMYGIFIGQLQSILPPTTNIPEAYANDSTKEQSFVQNLPLFTSFYKVHIHILESTQENISNLILGLEYLINISYVDDTEVFKDCLDYWNSTNGIPWYQSCLSHTEIMMETFIYLSHLDHDTEKHMLRKLSKLSGEY
ncbi:protein EXPORTIN 1A [Trifolium repens]|nr:protein EXPORTIN 1A [Trifolium repens]